MEELRDLASRPFFRARLRASASTACRRPSGLFFFCRDLSSGPDPPDFAPDFALDSAPDSAPDHKNSDLLALAETSHAKFLMTGERELLFLKHHKSTRIVAAAMIEVLKAQGSK